MAKVSPARTTFAGGVFSPLFIGRVDHDKYPSGMRSLHNFVAAPQGPALSRSGTEFMGKTFDNGNFAAFVPFVFSDDQALQLVFCNQYMFIMTDDGVVVTGSYAVTSVIRRSTFKFTSAAFVTAGGVVGDRVVLEGFPYETTLNGKFATVTDVTGNDVTLDISVPSARVLTGAITGNVAKVYTLATPYLHTHVRNIRYAQDLDVMYLFCAKSNGINAYPVYKLSRLGATNWKIEEVIFKDGPYEDENLKDVTTVPSVTTGIATSKHTGYTEASGTASASSELGIGVAWNAFSETPGVYWASAENQIGKLQYQFTAPKIIDGYSFYSTDQVSSGIVPSNRRPKDWTFEASNDGVTWVVLDVQKAYAQYTGLKTNFIALKNKTAYSYYRLNITSLEYEGAFGPFIERLVMREATRADTRLTFSAVDGINKDSGFNANDVGRLIRLYQSDGQWRPVRITARVSSLVVDVKLEGEPLYNFQTIARFRLGSFSVRTGFPTMGVFGYDRLIVGGVREYPTAIYGSQPQAYENMQPSEIDGTVQEDSGFNFRPKTRNASPLGWLAYTTKGIVCGFGAGEWLIQPANPNAAFSARNAEAVPSTIRGSRALRPIHVDSEILYVSKDGVTLREYAYVYQNDGFRSPSMSVMASDVGYPGIAQIEYSAAPHSIVWCRKDDGNLVGFTYNREEGILAWHTHSLGGDTNTVVEHMSVIPDAATNTDALWLIVRRTIDGVTQRVMERLKPFWSFKDEQPDAWGLDCALQRDGDMTDTVYAGHLEGQRVHGLADGVAFGYETEIRCEAGQIVLPFEAQKILVGLHFDAYGETTNIEAGAADGTAQGKTKRIHNIACAVWATLGLELGVYIERDGEEGYDYSPIDIEEEPGKPLLQTCIHKPILPPEIYNKRGSIAFRRTGPYPVNIIGLYPQMNTQDR